MSWKIAEGELKAGGVVIIPSDSVFGIAAAAGNETAVKKLYSIKKREDTKPSLVIVATVDQAKKLIKFTDLAQKLTAKYWPGGLTIVGEALDKSMSSLIYGEEKTLAIRLPDKKELIDLVQEVGPFILPSANLSGLPPANTLEEVDPQLLSQVDYVIKEKTDQNPVSTLVDIRGLEPIILRQGVIKI